MGHRRRSEFGGRQSKTAAQNNNEPPCPRKFLTQPTEVEKSGVLQHPLASLAHVPDLKVKSRNSVFRYKGKDVDIQQVGKDLIVDALLTGRVVQHGSRRGARG